MTTLILVICILLLPLLAAWVIGGRQSITIGGVIGIAAAFAFFGVGHYAKTEGMVTMLPEYIPFRRQIVLATGVLEFVISAGLLFPATRRASGLAAISILIGLFPANIYAALNHTGMGGHVWGPEYLLIRAPLQALLIGWVSVFALSRRGGARGPVSSPTVLQQRGSETDLHGTVWRWSLWIR